MLLARLVTVKPVNALGNEPRPGVVSTSGFERLLKLLTTLFGRK
jgi:hypothetical protein